MAKTRHSSRLDAGEGRGAGGGTRSLNGQGGSGSRSSAAATAGGGSTSGSRRAASSRDASAADKPSKRRRKEGNEDPQQQATGGPGPITSAARAFRRSKRGESVSITSTMGVAGERDRGSGDGDEGESDSSSSSSSGSTSSSAAVAASITAGRRSTSAAPTTTFPAPVSPAEETADPSTPQLLLLDSASPEPHSPPPAPAPPPPEPVDRLSHLSAELLALILSFLVVPPPPAPTPPAPPPGGALPNAAPLPGAPPSAADSLFWALSPPSPFPQPDRATLASLCLVSRSLLPHARAALYRKLEVETRVQAHAVHRTLHGSETSKGVREVVANVEGMARTSSQWLGWFLFHSMHSLCGIIGSCRNLLSLTLYLPADSSAWTGSLCQSFVDLKNLQSLTKDLEPSLPSSHRPSLPYSPSPYSTDHLAARSRSFTFRSGNGKEKKWSDRRGGGAGKQEGMDVGWRPRRSVSMWAVSQFIKPLSTLKSLTTLRLCGISSDSSTLPPPPVHALKLVEVVLIEVNITNTDLLHLLGTASSLQRFTLWRSSLLSKRGLTHVLKKCTKLVELRVGGSWFGAKEEDDKTFPLDDSLPHLPHLTTLFISGSLISPRALTLPSLNLSHLFVTNSPTWTPKEVHRGLVGMVVYPGGEPGVRRITLPEMRDPDGGGRSRGGRTRNSGSAGGGGGGAGGSGEQWNETWRFTVKRTGEAKGVRVGDRWKAGRVVEAFVPMSFDAAGGGGGEGGVGMMEEVEDEDEDEDEEDGEEED